MAIIHELDPHVINLIAAGEVVERPASAAKELLENAIDAGATRITIELQNGGISYLRVTDNGCGMSTEDATTAFRRHATSKLRSEDDLQSISTLGFRGEALAAMASVSRIDLLTKQKGSIAGTHVHIEGGETQIVEDAGCPEGTTIILRDLFFNTPARMKFLKKDYTEAGYILANVQQQALAHPEIAIHAVKEGKPVFSSEGNGKLEAPAYSVFGRELSQNMLEALVQERDGYRCFGRITKPHACRPNRSMQYFFVNGRYVRSRVMQAAMEEAYRHSMITGKYPAGCLFLTLPLNQVDVNVHPAKTEVKFAFEKQVYEAVYVCCKNALEANDNTPLVPSRAFATPAPAPNFVQEQIEVPVIIPKRLPEIEPIVAPVPMAQDAQVFAPDTQLPKETATLPADMLSLFSEPSVLPFASAETLDIEPTPLYPLPETPEIPPYTPVESWYRTPQDAYGRLLAGGKNIFDHKPERVQPSPEMVAEVHNLLHDRDPEKADKRMDTMLRQSCRPSYLNEPPEQALAMERATARVRIVGEAFSTYIMAEDEEGMLLIDKHAAHERMLFNKLRTAHEVSKQALLCTEIVDFTPMQFAILLENIETLDGLGFTMEAFGSNSMAVRAVPSYLIKEDLDSVLSEIALKLQNGQSPTPDRLDDLAHAISCRAAIKAGKNSQPEELLALCEAILDDPEVHSCPHGRPVMVRLTKYELDKLFKRVNQ